MSELLLTLKSYLRCSDRANDKAAFSAEIPLNSECLALMQLPELYELLGDMLAKDAAQRPSAREALQRLGQEWIDRLEDKRFPLGHEIPLLWQSDKEWSLGGSSSGGGSGGGGFRVGEACVVKRSDGKLKFAAIKSVNGTGADKYDVTVEPSGSFQKDVAGASLGRILI